MIRKLFFLALVLSAVSAPAPTHAQVLWGGTEYGMSLAQVKAIVPTATRPEKATELGTGAVEQLRLDDVEIANENFTASFYFISDKLTQVMLSLGKGRTFHHALLVYKSLSDALRAKYGREIANDIKRGLLNQASATWIVGRTNIDLLALSVGENDAVLNINYQVRVARDAEKL